MSTPPPHRRAVLSAALLCFAIAPLAAHAESAAIAPIERLYDALLGVMKLGTAEPFEQRYTQLAPTIEAVFDMSAILQTSVGLGWSQLSADEHAALLTAFRRYTIATYVSSFNQFDGQRFEVAPTTRALPNDDQMVSSRIIPVSGDSHELDYVMRQGPAGWRAVDVLAEGAISRVAVQRSDFRGVLSQAGAPALVTSLERKVIDMAGSALES